MPFTDFLQVRTLDKDVLYAVQVLGELRELIQKEYDTVDKYIKAGEKRELELIERAKELRKEVAKLRKEVSELERKTRGKKKRYPWLDGLQRRHGAGGDEYCTVRVHFLPGHSLDVRIGAKLYTKLYDQWYGKEVAQERATEESPE